MSENTSNICPNCQHQNHEGFNFCEQCGQKNRAVKITFFEFIKDFIDVVFNLDNRFWKTIKRLFIPGRLTKIFYQGRRKSFYHPLRLYVVAVLFLFTVLSFLNLDKGLVNVSNVDMRETYEQELLLKDQSAIINETLDSLKQVYNDQQSINLLDSISSSIFLINGRDTIYLNEERETDSTSMNIFYQQVSFTQNELFIDDIGQVIKEKKVKSILERLALKQMLKGIRDVKSFNAYIFANLTWLFLAIVPVFSLVLKLFYIRRKRFYMEHFVFLLHLFTALIFIVGLLLATLLPIGNHDAIRFTALIVAVIFPFLAFKNYYRQGIFKTIYKFLGIGFCFMIAFIITFAIFMVVSAALF